MSTIKVNTITKRSGSTLTLGESGTTVTLACGATQSGFGRTGTVDWCTTAKTSPFTSVSGKGYFVNTTSGVVTVTLPASPSAGDIVAVADYASTFDTNKLTLSRNGSKINGGCDNADITTEGASITLVYVDGTRGWKQVNDATLDITGAPNFICATGGTITTCGNFKIHKFTSDGTFTITSAPTPANNTVDYLVVAGGGGIGSSNRTGGGGGGGVRASSGASSGCYTAGPLAACVSGLPVSVQAYPISVGGGGAVQTRTPETQGTATQGCNGSNSVFSTITSAGGGGSGTATNPGGAPTMNGKNGGSGGGGSAANGQFSVGGTGNTPPVSPPQGNSGGAGVTPSGNYTGGGGGATEAGVAGVNGTAGRGGAGMTSCITASPVGYGGGGGGVYCNPSGTTGAASPCGSGAAGQSTPGSDAIDAAANRGGGGGGLRSDPTNTGGLGGSGIVVIRYKFQ